MSGSDEPFFSEFFHFSEPESEMAVRSLYDLLPSKFEKLKEFDKICVLIVCLDSIRSTLSPIRSRGFEVEIDNNLRQVVELSRELSTHLYRVGEITFVGERNLRQAWNAQVFRAFGMRNCDGHELEVPECAIHPINYSPSPAGAMRILSDIAEQAYRARKRTALKHRPNEDLLLAITYPLVRAWTAMECMSGVHLYRCFPTSRNEGQRFCWNAISMIFSGQLVGTNRLKKRSERTVTEAVRDASKELKRRLLSTPFAEDASRWRDLDWQSACGLDLLYRAARPPGRDCLLRQGTFIDNFDRRHCDWINSLKEIEGPIWVDDF